MRKEIIRTNAIESYVALNRRQMLECMRPSDNTLTYRSSTISIKHDAYVRELVACLLGLRRQRRVALSLPVLVRLALSSECCSK